ncbi:MAG: YkvA family protein [Actinomycetes bacterium]|jgi:uncharacterized membrane protein YkvA (DUF1232 family)|nr:MAG: hypothetical protein DIU67_08105 [Actinomycetota bacterium]
MSTDPIQPDEVISPDGERVRARAKSLLAEVVTVIPNLVKLISRLLKDPRVPFRAKLTLGAVALYVASPIDLLPEFIPVVGWMDDVLMVMYALDNLISRAGREVVVEHWDGPGDVLQLIEDVVGLGRTLMPRRLSGVLDKLSG